MPSVSIHIPVNVRCHHVTNKRSTEGLQETIFSHCEFSHSFLKIQLIFIKDIRCAIHCGTQELGFSCLPLVFEGRDRKCFLRYSRHSIKQGVSEV